MSGIDVVGDMVAWGVHSFYRRTGSLHVIRHFCPPKLRTSKVAFNALSMSRDFAGRIGRCGRRKIIRSVR